MGMLAVVVALVYVDKQFMVIIPQQVNFTTAVECVNGIWCDQYKSFKSH